MLHTVSIATGALSHWRVFAAVLALGGCAGAQISLDPDQTVVSACDGAFMYEGPVKLEGPPFQPNYETRLELTNRFDSNLKPGATASPGSRFTSAGETYRYHISDGKLDNPCMPGSILIAAIGMPPFPEPPNWSEPGLDTQKISVKSSPVTGLAPSGVTPTPDPAPGGGPGGKLILPAGAGYMATVSCCPGGPARAYTISTAGSPNMIGMLVAPAMLACPAAAPGPIALTITGALDIKSQPGKVILTVSGPDGSCKMITNVEAAR